MAITLLEKGCQLGSQTACNNLDFLKGQKKP
jgi:hypothetical protein